MKLLGPVRQDRRRELLIALAFGFGGKGEYRLSHGVVQRIPIHFIAMIFVRAGCLSALLDRDGRFHSGLTVPGYGAEEGVHTRFELADVQHG